VTAGIGVGKRGHSFIDANDDSNAILFKAIADRLAEAFAQCQHQVVRTDW
jgi:5-methyltetrahydrofolate--homocysteine methyltransferase